VGERLRRGQDFSTAIALNDPDAADPDKILAFDLANNERDELFNTRVSGYRAWAQAMQKLIPTPRGAARIDLTQIVVDSGSRTTGEAVDVLLDRFLRLPVSDDTRRAFVTLLDAELGTTDLARARTYLEDALRMVTHLIMSTPEYQID
jgi:predicted naringenin-chalcone synthase